MSTADSKFLSLVLRHRPDLIGITLDEAGWVDVSDLLAGVRRHQDGSWTPERLRAVVADNDKQRFAFSPGMTKIRASQGHSVPVKLGYSHGAPPQILFHGTVGRFLESIRATGLGKGRRHAVHLSPDEETAGTVGARRGSPILLEIRAGDMHHAGFAFSRSANGVWLTDHVPPEYIEFPTDTDDSRK
ncbi:MAG TPA: RNA 2'-phosphotransferase [Stellaceae bacterium]|jgi:putative RNA 2'-phosphotransferase